MMDFYIPLKEHDWAHKWFLDVYYIASYKNLNVRCPLDISEGHTQGISGFRFNLWEPICYFKECKAT